MSSKPTRRRSGEDETLFFSKTDLRSAFRILPILPEQRCYLLLKAKHPLTKKYMYFSEKCLPFRARISCAKFQSFSDSLHFLIEWLSGQNFSVTNYLDDYLFVQQTKADCDALVSQFLELCERINCPVVHDKTEWSAECMIFLGILLDGANKMLVVPEEKRRKALFFLNLFIGKNKATIKEIQRLTGTLNFLGKAIVPGRMLTRGLYSKLKLKDVNGKGTQAVSPCTTDT